MTMSESNSKPSSPRMPCYHTNCVAAFTAPLFLALADYKEIVLFLLIDHKIGPYESMNTLPEVEF